MLRPTLALVLVFLSTSASAAWVLDTSQGCKVDVQYPAADEQTRWSGACVDGLAEGEGVLTSSNGALLKGEFRKGKPFKAAGWELLLFNGGGRAMTSSSYAEGAGFQGVLSHAQADKRASPITSAPMVGKWSWVPTDVACPELHEFAADGVVRMSNGEVKSESAYTVFKIAKEPSTFRVLFTALSRKGQSACEKDPAPVGASYYVYMRFEDDDHFRACSAKEESSCFGVGSRVR